MLGAKSQKLWDIIFSVSHVCKVIVTLSYVLRHVKFDLYGHKNTGDVELRGEDGQGVAG